MPKNKVKFGLKNVHYAKATIAEDGTAEFETPVAVPGAVNLSMDASGEMEPFYADNIKYYISNDNQGYEGDLEMALFPDQFRKDIWGDIEDQNGVLVENADAPVEHFALLFQFEGDVKATRHVLYNCTAARPSVGSGTKEDTTTPQTETSAISGGTILLKEFGPDGADVNIPKSSTTPDTNATAYNSWFDTVYVPVKKTAGE